jgi:hypothetical protein
VALSLALCIFAVVAAIIAIPEIDPSAWAHHNGSNVQGTA